MTIREALPQDVTSIHGLIVELAKYERAVDEVLATPADLQASLFAEPPLVHAHVAVDMASTSKIFTSDNPDEEKGMGER